MSCFCLFVCLFVCVFCQCEKTKLNKDNNNKKEEKNGYTNGALNFGSLPILGHC